MRLRAEEEDWAGREALGPTGLCAVSGGGAEGGGGGGGVTEENGDLVRTCSP